MSIIDFLYLRKKNNLAFYDNQTKIFNRNWWEIRGKAKYEFSQVYITVFDLNNLKDMNDTYGHQVGDKYIFNFVEGVSNAFPGNDFCRLGGDEFLLITYDNPVSKLNKLNHAKVFSYGTYHKESSVNLSVSIKMADAKMYEMKKKLKCGR